MNPFFNRCNTASGSGHLLSSSRQTAWKKRSERIPVRDYKADEELVAESLISLSQSAAAATDPTTTGDHTTNPSPDPHKNIIYDPAVHRISFFVSGQKLHGRPASDNKCLATLTSSRKLHQCDACGECFETGQRLGGHKRKHFTGVILKKVSGGQEKGNASFFSGTSTGIGGATSYGGSGEVAPTPPRRELNLDLNLPPPTEDCGLNLDLYLPPPPGDCGMNLGLKLPTPPEDCTLNLLDFYLPQPPPDCGLNLDLKLAPPSEDCTLNLYLPPSPKDCGLNLDLKLAPPSED